jgi:hypothetical protein
MRHFMPPQRELSLWRAPPAYGISCATSYCESSFAISTGTPRVDHIRLAACLASFGMVELCAWSHGRAWRRVHGTSMSRLSTQQIDAQRDCSCDICDIFVVHCLENYVQWRDDCFESRSWQVLKSSECAPQQTTESCSQESR